MAVRSARWDRLDVARAMPWPGRSWPSRLIWSRSPPSGGSATSGRAGRRSASPGRSSRPHRLVHRGPVQQPCV